MPRDAFMTEPGNHGLIGVQGLQSPRQAIWNQNKTHELINIKERNRRLDYARPAKGARIMSLSSAARTVLSKIADWWHDREDERLDELVASYEKGGSAAESRVTAYRLANRARDGDRQP